VEVDEGRQVEICEVVGITGEEKLFTGDPAPIGDESTGAAEQLGLEKCPYCGRASAALDMVADDLWQVMRVYDHLVDAGLVQGVQPDVEQGLTADV
jgi:hypothetical protein